MTATRLSAPLTLARDQWQMREREHHARADALTAGRRDRASRGETHAVEDFLYDYYGTKPARVRRWYPGIGAILEAADARAGWRWHVAHEQGVTVDARAFWRERGDAVDFIEQLLTRTAGRAPHLGCFGMHEWAMVYRAEDRRHDLPLRLGQAGTDAVVEAHPLTCTHFDAFRFFTPAAAPLNATQLTRATQSSSEQPGCLHATMDLYKWCIKLTPAVPSELMLECFALALDVRRVDMQASPYDVSGFGLDPIAVETPEGKSAYAERQRDFARRGGALREQLIEACQRIRAAAREAA